MENITLDGNRDHNANLDGNYAGCIWMQDCTKIVFRKVTARYTPVQIFADEPSGQGTVTPNPVGTACGPACWAYPYASAVTVTAAPAEGWAFRRWSTEVAGDSRPSPC